MTALSAGGEHACAIESGAAYCWGENYNGELGDGNNTNSSVPVAVVTSGALAGKTLTQITAGYEMTCALDSEGTAYCWGRDVEGELGNGSTTNSNIPVAVDAGGALAGQILTQITAGVFHVCAMDMAGAAYCWGSNYYGQLGDGSTTSSSVPVAVVTSGALAGKAVTHVSAGYYDTCALDSAGAAYCWGYNGNGQLGHGTTTNSSVPVAVVTSGALAGQTLTQLNASWYHTCAVDAAGAAFCWGDNSDGQLGDGSTTSSSVPVAVAVSGVLAGKTISNVTIGDYDTCAMDSAGLAYCWGDNTHGELGDDATIDSSVPVAVDTAGVLAGKTLTQVTAGIWHACALDTTGSVYCWGRSVSGELGDDSNSASSVPVLVGPRAPTGVTADPGFTSATMSWTASADLDGGTLTGYTATASPGGAACTTAGATTCVIAGLASGTTYSVTVVTQTGFADSAASTLVIVTTQTGCSSSAKAGHKTSH